MWYSNEKCSYRNCQEYRVNSSKFCAYHRNVIYKLNKQKVDKKVNPGTVTGMEDAQITVTQLSMEF